MRARLKIWSLRISIALVCAIVLVVAGLMTTAGQRAALSLAGQIAAWLRDERTREQEEVQHEG